MPNDIHRFGPSGDLIEIPAPTADAAQFCLEFAQDFRAFLVTRLSSLRPVESPKPKIDEIQQFLRSPVVPASGRQLFDEQKAQVERALMQVKIDPIGDAVTSLLGIATFCGARLST